MLTTIVSGIAAAFKAVALALGLIQQNKDQQAGAAIQRDVTASENQNVTSAELKAAVDAPHSAADTDSRLRNGSA